MTPHRFNAHWQCDTCGKRYPEHIHFCTDTQCYTNREGVPPTVTAQEAIDRANAYPNDPPGYTSHDPYPSQTLDALPPRDSYRTEYGDFKALAGERHLEEELTNKEKADLVAEAVVTRLEGRQAEKQMLHEIAEFMNLLTDKTTDYNHDMEYRVDQASSLMTRWKLGEYL